MTQPMKVDSSAIVADVQRFDDWATQLDTGWTQLESDLAPHTAADSFGTAVPGLAAFRQTYGQAMGALKNYAVGGAGASSALRVFRDRLKFAAAMYDAARDAVSKAVDVLPAE